LIVPASRRWEWLMDRLGIDGIAMPWGKAYIRKSCFGDVALRAHEAEHLAQMQRMGPVWFSLVYVWQLARYGYWNAPLEIEARRKEG
jgi:hypothetical protein